MRRRSSESGCGRRRHQSVDETLDRSTNKEDAGILVGLAQSNGVDSDAATDRANWAERLLAPYQPTRVSAVWLRLWQPDGDSRLARVPVAPG